MFDNLGEEREANGGLRDRWGALRPQETSGGNSRRLTVSDAEVGSFGPPAEESISLSLSPPSLSLL